MQYNPFTENPSVIAQQSYQDLHYPYRTGVNYRVDNPTGVLPVRDRPAALEPTPSTNTLSVVQLGAHDRATLGSQAGPYQRWLAQQHQQSEAAPEGSEGSPPTPNSPSPYDRSFYDPSEVGSGRSS